MSFSSLVSLGTLSSGITSVKLLACTGLTCTNGTVITGFDNVLVSSFPRTITGVPDGTKYIKVEALGTCVGTSQCIEITGISTPTPTPTATGTPTPTPTPTPTLNIDVDPLYYYYALGDCTDMRYSYTGLTITGFSPPIAIPGCDTAANIGTLALQDPAHTSIYVDYNDPCGFGQNYSGVAIARSSTQLTEGTVYNVGGSCLSVVAVQTQNVSGWTYDLDGKTAESGANPCYNCSPPFTGFTFVGYSGVTCDTNENIMVYTIFGGLHLGHVYGVQLYSGGTMMGESKCATLTTSLGEQFTMTDPSEGITGYAVSDGGPFVLGQPFFDGYGDCTGCNATVKKYYVAAERCDTNQYSISLWLDSVPTVNVGDSIMTSFDSHCWRVIQADQYRSVVYYDLGFTITSTGCDC
jgi:hypothetical protein